MVTGYLALGDAGPRIVELTKRRRGRRPGLLVSPRLYVPAPDRVDGAPPWPALEPPLEARFRRRRFLASGHTAAVAADLLRSRQAANGPTLIPFEAGVRSGKEQTGGLLELPDCRVRRDGGRLVVVDDEHGSDETARAADGWQPPIRAFPGRFAFRPAALRRRAAYRRAALVSIAGIAAIAAIAAIAGLPAGSGRGDSTAVEPLIADGRTAQSDTADGGREGSPAEDIGASGGRPVIPALAVYDAIVASLGRNPAVLEFTLADRTFSVTLGDAPTVDAALTGLARLAFVSDIRLEVNSDPSGGAVTRIRGSVDLSDVPSAPASAAGDPTTAAELFQAARSRGLVVTAFTTDGATGAVHYSVAGPVRGVFEWVAEVDRALRGGLTLRRLSVSPTPAGARASVDLAETGGGTTHGAGIHAEPALHPAVRQWPALTVEERARSLAVVRETLRDERPQERDPGDGRVTPAAADRPETAREHAPPVLLGVVRAGGVDRVALRFETEHAVHSVAVGETVYGWRIVDISWPRVRIEKEEGVHELNGR